MTEKDHERRLKNLEETKVDKEMMEEKIDRVNEKMDTALHGIVELREYVGKKFDTFGMAHAEFLKMLQSKAEKEDIKKVDTQIQGIDTRVQGLEVWQIEQKTKSRLWAWFGTVSTSVITAVIIGLVMKLFN